MEHQQQPSNKRRKLSHNKTISISNKWQSSHHQHIYSTSLLRALRSNPPPSHVRHAADQALAISAKASTRWSRAILKRRRTFLKLRKVKKVKVTGAKRSKREKRRKVVDGVEKRVRVLSRLVPGCRKVSFPNLLEEATDYIAALQMQVRAMAALANILTNPPQQL